MKSPPRGLIHCTASAPSVPDADRRIPLPCYATGDGGCGRSSHRPHRIAWPGTPRAQHEKAPGSHTSWDPGASNRDNGVVELGGIEPPSNAESPRLLRAQSVQTFYSAPTFVTDT
ncbi:hypothetical protein MICRO8M_100083 [Microbacterium sp. 8M]|nr:hypothetical protein MICRO8M_100083 [Microbacterium sp. 8M]